MKSLFFIFLLITCISFKLSSASDSDSLKNIYTKIETANKHLDSLSKKVTALEVKVNKPAEVKCNKNAAEFNWQEWLVIFFMPATILLFAFILLYVLKKSPEFNIAKVIGIGSETKEGTATQSSSRFIAILTGLTAIFVATTLVMYNGYMMVAQCNNVLDLDGLWKILAGLGIGIIPYGINVWNKNIKEEAATGAANNQQTPQS